MKQKPNTQIVKVLSGELPSQIERTFPPLHVSDYIQAFLDSQDVRKNSKETYRQGLLCFSRWQESNQVFSPLEKDIINFKAFLSDGGKKANTVNVYLVAVKRFFDFAEDRRIYPNIAKKVKSLKQAKGHLRETPLSEQVRGIYANIDTSTLRGKRDKAMLVLMTNAGCRTIEIVRANIEDIRYIGNEAKLFYQGKGKDSKGDSKTLTQVMLEPIYDYLKARGKAGPSEPLFVSCSDRNEGKRLTTKTLQNLGKAAFRSIGIDNPKLTCHSFRHFAATNAHKNKASLLQIAAMLGHASITTTQIYVHAEDRFTNAAERCIETLF